jgi:hypothetical protein
MSAYKIKTPGNYPEESIQHLEQRENLKSKTSFIYPILVSCEITNYLCFGKYNISSQAE